MDAALPTAPAAQTPDARRPGAPLRLAALRRPVVAAAYRAGVAVVGTAVVLAGLVLVPLPGPGWPVVFVGLALLGTEFSWAGRLSAVVRDRVARAGDRVRAAGWVWRTAAGVGLVLSALGPLVLLAA